MKKDSSYMDARFATSSLGKCAVVHAGNRDGYEASWALFSAGYEVHLVTDYYHDDSKWHGKLMRYLMGARVYRRSKRGLKVKVHSGIVLFLADYLHQIIPRSEFVTRLKARALASKLRRADQVEKFNFILFYFNSGLYEFIKTYGEDERIILFQMHPHPILLRDVYKKFLEKRPFLESQMLSEEPELNKDEAAIIKLAMEAQFATHIICPSNFVKYSLTQYGVEDKKISTVPYGAPFPNQASGPDNVVKHMIQPLVPKIQLAFVGQFVIRKGVYDLIKFAAQSPDVHLTVYTRDLHYASRRMQEWGIVADNIEFLRIREHDVLWESLAKKDFLVLPSLAEGFGLVITEALSLGIPVIATSSTCAPDLIEDGRSGFVIESCSVENLRDVVDRAFSVRTSWPSMKLKAREIAHNRSWEIFRKGLIDAIRQAIPRDIECSHSI